MSNDNLRSPWDYPEGMTVLELRQLVNTWPVQHQDGTPTRILLLGEPVTSVCPTNWQQAEGSNPTADLWLINNLAMKASDLFEDLNK